MIFFQEISSSLIKKSLQFHFALENNKYIFHVIIAKFLLELEKILIRWNSTNSTVVRGKAQVVLTEIINLINQSFPGQAQASLTAMVSVTSCSYVHSSFEWNLCIYYMAWIYSIFQMMRDRQWHLVPSLFIFFNVCLPFYSTDTTHVLFTEPINLHLIY